MTNSTNTRRSMFLLAILGWLWAHSSFASTPDLVLTVGSDPECDYSTIEAAYAAIPNQPGAEVVELRLEAETFLDTRIDIDDLATRPARFHLRIRGGFASCGASNSSGRTRLEGTDEGPILRVAAGRPRGPREQPELHQTIEIERLTFDQNQLTEDSGAGLHVTAGHIYLRNVTFSSLRARGKGGAIFIATAPDNWKPSLDMEETSFFSTVARASSPGEEAAGGGIYCEADSSVGRIQISGSLGTVQRSEALVISASGAASGGFAAVDHCEARLIALPTWAFATEAHAVSRPARGGFIYATGQSDVEITGTLTIATPAVDSTAEARGGAFYVDGASRLTLQSVRSRGPRAPGGMGGFLYAADPQTTVAIGCDAAGGCASGQTPPSWISDASAFAGGALALERHAVLEASGTVLSSPSSDATGAATFLNTGAVARLLGSRVTGASSGIPTVASVFEARSGAVQFLERVTTAENDGVSHLLGGDGSTRPGVSSSILAESSDGPQIFGPLVNSLETDGCVLTSINQDLPANATGWTVVSDPSEIGFDRQAEAPYRLAEDSMARDLCPPARATDLDGDSVGFDLSRSATPVDAGADEWVPRRRVCFDVDTSLESPERLFTGRVPGPGFVGDVNLITEAGSGDRSYYIYLTAKGKTRQLADDINIYETVSVFDDEAEEASGSQFEPNLPEESLSVFDDLPIGDTVWTLRIADADDGDPTFLERWCLDIAVSPTTHSIFADGFETGNMSRWSVP